MTECIGRRRTTMYEFTEIYCYTLTEPQKFVVVIYGLIFIDHNNNCIADAGTMD